MISFNLIWKNEKTQIEISKDSQTEDIFKESARFSKINIDRIRLYIEKNGSKIPLPKYQPVSEIPSNSIIIVDSGPQFSFMINDLFEYIPPIFIWIQTLFFIQPKLNKYINTATLMWQFHFTKRSLEAVFVHTYSQKTLPIFSLLDNSCFKNCIYYWTFAVLISFSVIKRWNFQVRYPELQNAGIWLFIISEILNGYCHIRLRFLRPKGSLGHYLPTGFLFNQITCPNYTFEILAWIGFGLFTQSIFSFLFPLCGGAQMLLWADEKRKKLATKYPEVMKRGRITPFSFF